MVNIAYITYKTNFIMTHKRQVKCTLQVVSSKVSHCNLLTKKKKQKLKACWSFCGFLVGADASYDISVKKMLYFIPLRLNF